MRLANLRGALACVVLTVLFFGCGHITSVTIGKSGPYVSHDREGHGPPPHAPAHGHRRKQHDSAGGLELVFDSEVGVYVVVDIPNHYYWDGYYLRIENGSWYASTKLESGWKSRSSESLPPGLRKKQSKHGKTKKHPGKGHSPAKGHW